MNDLQTITGFRLPDAGATPEFVRGFIVAIEEAVKNLPNSFVYGINDGPFKLKHSFSGGVYAREFYTPAGTLVVSKIHKYEHHAFVLKGKVSVFSEFGVQEIEGPCSFISPAGIKRVLYFHEETIWTTIHRTDETDVPTIEKEITADRYEELGIPYEAVNIGGFLCHHG